MRVGNCIRSQQDEITLRIYYICIYLPTTTYIVTISYILKLILEYLVSSFLSCRLCNRQLDHIAMFERVVGTLALRFFTSILFPSGIPVQCENIKSYIHWTMSLNAMPGHQTCLLFSTSHIKWIKTRPIHKWNRY